MPLQRDKPRASLKALSIHDGGEILNSALQTISTLPQRSSQSG